MPAQICVTRVFLTSTFVFVGDWHLGQMIWVGPCRRSALSTIIREQIYQLIFELFKYKIDIWQS
jgi:hypothetical protein